MAGNELQTLLLKTSQISFKSDTLTSDYFLTLISISSCGCQVIDNKRGIPTLTRKTLILGNNLGNQNKLLLCIYCDGLSG